MLSYISYNPIVEVELGPLSISPHGVGIAVGFLLGARLMIPEAERKGISEDNLVSVLMWAALGSLIGARLAYVINHISDYADAPLDALRVWEGGISLLGGIFGAILLAMPQMKKRGMDFWRAMDAAAPGIALGIIVGRIGDLIVADHLGKTTDFFLGYRCTAESASPCGTESGPNVVGAIVHQTALYDLILTTLLLLVLLTLRKRPRYDGFLIVFFGAWYGVGRVIEDFLREDLRRFGLTGSQWTAVATLTVCIGWLLFVKRTPRWGHWGEVGTEPGTGIDGDGAGHPETGDVETTPSISAPLEADGLDREE